MSAETVGKLANQLVESWRATSVARDDVTRLALTAITGDELTILGRRCRLSVEWLDGAPITPERAREWLVRLDHAE